MDGLEFRNYPKFKDGLAQLSEAASTALTLTDFNDVTVLVTTGTREGLGMYDGKAKNLDGSDANGFDKGTALLGLFLPVVSGAAVSRFFRWIGDEKQLSENAIGIIKKSNATNLPKFFGTWNLRKINFGSEAAAKYQSYISGKPLKSYKNGVGEIEEFDYNGKDFDGFSDGVLYDAKYGYEEFLNPDVPGKLKKWVINAQGVGLLKRATDQIKAAAGTPVKWVFSSKKSMIAVENFLKEKGITDIQFQHIPAQQP